MFSTRPSLSIHFTSLFVLLIAICRFAVETLFVSAAFLTTTTAEADTRRKLLLRKDIAAFVEK